VNWQVPYSSAHFVHVAGAGAGLGDGAGVGDGAGAGEGAGEGAGAGDGDGAGDGAGEGDEVSVWYSQILSAPGNGSPNTSLLQPIEPLACSIA